MANEVIYFDEYPMVIVYENMFQIIVKTFMHIFMIACVLLYDCNFCLNNICICIVIVKC